MTRIAMMQAESFCRIGLPCIPREFISHGTDSLTIWDQEHTDARNRYLHRRSDSGLLDDEVCGKVPVGHGNNRSLHNPGSLRLRRPYPGNYRPYSGISRCQSGSHGGIAL